jgi:hypothetical protein
LAHQQKIWNIGHALNRSTSLDHNCKIETIFFKEYLLISITQNKEIIDKGTTRLVFS